MTNASELKATEKAKIQRVGWKLLTSWWCVPVDAKKEDLLREIVKREDGPSTLYDVIQDRCFGGFRCEDPSNRHVLHSTGHYTYIGDNWPMEEGEREKIWNDLLKENATGDGRFIGGGPFTDDVPESLLRSEGQP